MKKNALILLVAVAISTVSCVDNAVSPQVEAIRSQQVEWMKAKTAGQVASNAMLAAETAYKVASDAILLKTKEADYATLVAENADALIIAKYNMAIAKANFESSVKSLADAAIASGDEKAKAYLSKYTNEALSLASAIEDRLTIQENLVAQELLVASNSNVLEVYLAEVQSNIDAENATIVGAEAAIAVYNQIEAGRDVSSFEAEAEALLLTNQTNVLNNIKLLYDITRNDIVIAEKQAEADDLGVTKIAQVDSRDTKIEEKGNLEDTNTDGVNDEDIAALVIEIAKLNASIAVIDAKIKVLDASIATLETSNDDKTEQVSVNEDLNTKNSVILNALFNVISEILYADNYNGMNYYSGNQIDYLIGIQKDIISESKDNLVGLTESLSATSVKQAKINAQKLVVTLTKELATADVAITAQEKIVAYWKALLDKIFTA